MKYLLAILGGFLFCQPALAFSSGIDGSTLTPLWIVPFAGILFSLAFMPLIAEKLWHDQYGKLALFWAVCFLIPAYFTFGFETTAGMLGHALIKEYIPFVLLLFALFTITGGVRILGRWQGCPKSNTILLGIGTVLASIIGTTGASMLLIHPLLRANKWRVSKKHTVIFFIFLVSNIGGALTPLGDPPLFLGFLNGVDFFWTTTNLYDSFLMVSIPLLIIFYGVDTWFYNKEDLTKLPKTEEKFHISGWANIALLVGVIILVLMSGYWKSSIVFSVFSIKMPLQEIIRDIGLVLLALMSIKLSKEKDRIANEFHWEPILEIAKIFLAIFITVIPVIAMLQAGQKGMFSTILQWVNTDQGPNNVVYFWLTGLLSSFLDNALTYLVFFNMAGGDAATLMTDLAKTLASISEGAVFMGALTYIGNAPNFMVRSIAVHKKVKMPSFFGYMLWSIGILVPIFILLTLVYIR